MTTDLVLHQEPDPEAARCDGRRLGQVVERNARQWGTAPAFPLMDLRLEKADLLARLGVDESTADRFHFPEPFDTPTREALHHGDAPRMPGECRA